MEESNYAISDLVADMSELALQELADKDKSVKFFVELGENVTDNLIGDVDKIRNILVRLLDNAIRYTKQGSITLSVDSYGYTDHAHQDMLNIVFNDLQITGMEFRKSGWIIYLICMRVETA